MKKICLLASAILAASFITSGCGGGGVSGFEEDRTKDLRQLRQLPELWVHAFETENAPVFLSCYSPDYQGSGGTYADLTEFVREVFNPDDEFSWSVDVTNVDRIVFLDGRGGAPLASLKLEYAVSWYENGELQRFQTTEIWTLLKEGGRWQILEDQILESRSRAKAKHWRAIQPQ